MISPKARDGSAVNPQSLLPALDGGAAPLMIDGAIFAFAILTILRARVKRIPGEGQTMKMTARATARARCASKLNW